MSTDLDQKLECWSDSLIGTIGKSFTSRDLQAVSEALFKYKTTHNIDVFCVGYDSRLFSSDFAEELVERLASKGLPVVVIDQPSPIFLLSWLATQTDKHKNSLGIYVGGDAAPVGRLSISFRNSNGSPFLYKQTREIHGDYLYFLNANFDFVDRRRDPEYIDLREGYAKWLIDTLQPSQEKFAEAEFPRIGVDYLTSPAKPYLQPLLAACNTGIISVPEDFWAPLVLSKQLRPSPSGWPLQYALRKCGASSINIAFDGDADCIGMYDGVTAEELSPSALFIILLHYLAKVRKKRGTILISKALSEKVSILASSYGFAVEYVNNGLAGLSEQLSKKRRSPALMYGDEFGGFWFKGLPLDRNPFAAILFILEACNKYKLSPGELYDKIIEGKLSRTYVSGKVDLYPNTIDAEKLSDLLENKTPLGNYTVTEFDKGGVTEDRNIICAFDAHIYKLNDGSRAVLQANPKNNFIELYVESVNKESMNEVITHIQKAIFVDDLPVVGHLSR